MSGLIKAAYGSETRAKNDSYLPLSFHLNSLSTETTSSVTVSSITKTTCMLARYNPRIVHILLSGPCKLWRIASEQYYRLTPPLPIHPLHLFLILQKKIQQLLHYRATIQEWSVSTGEPVACESLDGRRGSISKSVGDCTVPDTSDTVVPHESASERVGTERKASASCSGPKVDCQVVLMLPTEPCCCASSRRFSRSRGPY